MSQCRHIPLLTPLGPYLPPREPLQSVVSYDTPQRIADINLYIHNAEVYLRERGLSQVPCQYHRLIAHTQSFIETVEALARLPHDFPNVALLLIDFGFKILEGGKSGFNLMLTSQRCHIFWMLDDALLKMCLDEWERPDDGNNTTAETPWHHAIDSLDQRVNNCLSTLPDWAYEPLLEELEITLGWTWRGHASRELSEWMESYFFIRSRKFWKESMKIYWTKRKVNACLKDRLPKELADDIIDQVLDFEGLPVERLRTKYFPKGKCKVT